MKDFFKNLPPNAVHVISDFATGQFKIVDFEDLTDEELYDDCPICQELKQQANAAKAKKNRKGGYHHK
jgi:hypothetical protein